MQIEFTGHGIDVTDSLKKFTQEKFERIHRHFDKITATRVTLRVDKLEQIAEATILIVKDEIHAHASSEKMYDSITELAHKLDALLIKHKEKICDRRDHRDHHGSHRGGDDVDE